jgi:pSer/pThr/pTyr-binding forkhead associated (FHA) protein
VEALFFLQKATETGFSHMVTVGRTRRADIPLVSEKVSKVHAYFTWSEGRDTYFITDGNSTNGTRVNGVAIPPRQATPLKDHATIQVGEFELKFMSPKSLYRFLKVQR